MEKRVIVCGSIFFDIIRSLKKDFQEYSLEQGRTFSISQGCRQAFNGFGGTAGNIAYNLGCLGAKPVLLGKVGPDFTEYEAHLSACGVDTSRVTRSRTSLTPSVIIITDAAGNQKFFPFTGRYNTKYCDKAKKIENAGLAIVSPDLGTEPMMRYARIYKETGVPYIFDPGQATADFTGREMEEAVSGARIVIGNEYEMRMVGERTSLSGGTLRDIPGFDFMITTRGERGITIFDYRGTIQQTNIPAAPADRFVDPTGAGDAFRAGLIYGLMDNRPIGDCARLGAVIASFAIERLGTQNHRPDRNDIDARYAKAYCVN